MSKITKENSTENILDNSNKIISKPINLVNKTSYNNNKGIILSLLTNKDKDSNRRNSFKTTDTNFLFPPSLDYNYQEIKRFDEFNDSLSNISEFDLEKDNEDNSEFNSSEEDNNDSEVEFIEIKSRKKIYGKENDIEYEIQLEKECDEIVNKLIEEKNKNL